MLSRREMIKIMGVAGLGVITRNFSLANIVNEKIVKRRITSTGELLPVIGLGTWLTFDVGSSKGEREQLKQVLLLMKEKERELLIHLQCTEVLKMWLVI